MPDPVRQQYELLPYPARDPREEAQRLIEGSPSHLLELNHYLYAGVRDFTQPFRALVAGGGTGDGARWRSSAPRCAGSAPSPS